MHTLLRPFLVILGALVFADLANGRHELLAVSVGALIGLVVTELIRIRSVLAGLRDELDELRARVARPGTARSGERASLPSEPLAAPVPAVRAQPAPAPQATSAPTPAPASLLVRAPLGEHLPPPSSAWRPPEPQRSESPTIALIREFVTGGNTLVRLGVVVLFFGVAFLLRYLAEHTRIPIEFRLSGVAASALVLLVLGWHLRSRRRGYGLALQGGAIGVLYLLVFSTLHLYALLSPGVAFGLLVVISVLSGTLAVLQGSLAVALLSVTGGFLAPFLVSTGHGDHVVLFSYFVVLDLVILGIAWFRSWRSLNVAGFAFTFVLSAVWGVLQYRPEDFASSEPFLVLFFLLYVAITLIYSARQASAQHAYVDGTLVFGTPIAGFGLQAAMLHDHRLALAASALVVSGLYTFLAWALYRRARERQDLLVEAFMSLAVAFLTLAVPLALDGRWSAASWGLEGAALVWIGCRQNRRVSRACGALLQLAAGFALVRTLLAVGAAPSGSNVAAMVIGLTSVYAARTLHVSAPRLAEYESAFSPALFLWGLLWWCVGGINELQDHLGEIYWPASRLLFAAATAVISGVLARRSRMAIALLPTVALWPVMVLSAGMVAARDHPLAHAGWLAWPIAFASCYVILRRNEDGLPSTLVGVLHATALWLLTALVSWECAWNIDQISGSQGAWAVAAWGMIPAIVATGLSFAVQRDRWPFRAHRSAYAILTTTGLCIYLAVWSIAANAVRPDPAAPLAYLPFANPLDLAQALVLLVLVRTWLRLRIELSATSSSIDERAILVGLALIGFWWLNAVLLRSLHAWMGIPYELQALLRSTLVQSALSLLWALLALTTMLVATRTRIRALWLMGATLLGIVILKLFLVDLSSVGTVERIVSFVGVGILMLVLGYFSPLPPAAEKH